MKTTTVALIALMLAGCATCREHKVACGVAAAFVVGAVAAGASSNSSSQTHGYAASRPVCSGGPC